MIKVSVAPTSIDRLEVALSRIAAAVEALGIKLVLGEKSASFRCDGETIGLSISEGEIRMGAYTARSLEERAPVHGTRSEAKTTVSQAAPIWWTDYTQCRLIEALDTQRLDWGASRAGGNQLSHDIANARPELESVPGKPTGMKSVLRAGGRPHDRKAVRRKAFDAGP